MISNVFNGDCMEYMKTFPDKYFELAIVDPPYGLGDKLTSGGTWSVKWQDKGAEWDKLPNEDYFNELFRVSQNWIVWGGNYFIKYFPNCRHFIAWHKPYMDGMHSMSNVELALSSFDKNAKKVSINKEPCERIHITQKPVKLYKWLLTNYAKPGDKILDTHLGSQSSRIAAHDLGFDFWGSELDKDYFDAGCKRYENHIKQLTIF